MAREQVIHIHPDAPVKPAWGQPCNGCGVCCLSEPCPVGMLLSRRRHGACEALRWVDRHRADATAAASDAAPGAASSGAYRCGLLLDARSALPRWAQPAAPLLQQLARRFIAAGIGCDCDSEVSDAAG